jgi:hypothetical protein
MVELGYFGPVGWEARMSAVVKDCSMPARVARAIPSHHDLTGRRWTILKGGNREGVLTAVSGGAGLWGFEGLRCGVP